VEVVLVDTFIGFDYEFSYFEFPLA